MTTLVIIYVVVAVATAYLINLGEKAVRYNNGEEIKCNSIILGMSNDEYFVKEVRKEMQKKFYPVEKILCIVFWPVVLTIKRIKFLFLFFAYQRPSNSYICESY